jgi:uncharacterized protein YndB with AHSA1/START domain
METEKNRFSIVRTFKAPIDLVFGAFSDAGALEKWWGPVEAPIEVIKLDFRPGGSFHFKMNGEQVMYGLFKYQNIREPDQLSWISSFANEKGEIIKPPFEGLDVPREILNEIVLAETDGITTLTLSSRPINANDDEIGTFNSIAESMEQGYGGTFNQLEEYLKVIQNEKG